MKLPLLVVAFAAIQVSGLEDLVVNAVEGEPETPAETFERDSLWTELTGGPPDPDDEDYFRTILYRAVLAGFSTAIIADAVQLSEAMVRRWMNGSVSPHRIMRMVFYDQLKELLKKKG